MYRHLLYNLLDILIGGFHCTIHLRSIRRRVVMLDLKGLTKLLHHFVDQIRPIVGNDLLRHSVTTYNIMLNEASYHLLGNVCLKM